MSGKIWPPVLLTPVVNLPPVSMKFVVNLPPVMMDPMVYLELLFMYFPIKFEMALLEQSEAWRKTIN
jgi:hypothetical protein